MNKKNTIILILIVLGVIVLSISYFLYPPKKQIEINNQKTKQGLGRCLNEDEQADFTIKRLGTYPSPDYDRGFIEVMVKKVNTDKEIVKFKIDNIINPSHYHPIELHRCGVYVIKVFNYDPNKTKQDPGYREEIWLYDYNGNGEPLILLAEKPNEFISYYSPDFRIDQQEQYIVLEKGYLGKEDYSLVFKDIRIKENKFVLLANIIIEQYPNIIGVFDMREWTKDGRYFWGSISKGAYVFGYFRIDNQNWKTDIFEAPEGVGGGDALNIEKGLVTRHPGYIWTGMDILTEQIKQEWREQGKKSTLHLYNLFTKEQMLLETTDEPLWFFKPRWLSDIELEYYLPTGERKIYKIAL